MPSTALDPIPAVSFDTNQIITLDLFHQTNVVDTLGLSTVNAKYISFCLSFCQLPVQHASVPVYPILWK